MVRACNASLALDVDTTGPIQLASDLLYALSGSRWSGSCGERTYRPCQGSNCGCAPLPLAFNDVDLGALEFTAGLRPWGACDRRCRLAKVRVPGPIMSVTEIRIDGQVLDPSLYRTRGSYVERLDGQRWPCGQNLTLALDQPDTFGIIYVRGAAIPPSGQMAATQLTVALLAAMCGGHCGDMTIGLRATAREGNNWEFEDPTQLANAGKTGVYLVDEWLSAVNPHGRRRRAAIFGVEDIGRG